MALHRQCGGFGPFWNLYLCEPGGGRCVGYVDGTLTTRADRPGVQFSRVVIRRDIGRIDDTLRFQIRKPGEDAVLYDDLAIAAWQHATLGRQALVITDIELVPGFLLEPLRA